ncbi:MAG: DUF4410 domain-containing protein [candidate division NC10 bacterium]
MKQKVRLFRQLFPRHLVVSLLLSLVVGCASATTQQTGQRVEDRTLPRPPVLLIYDFAVAPDDAPPSAEIERHRAIAKAFSEDVVTKVEGVGIPAQRATDSTTVPLHAVVVKGQFVTIQEGSRTRRMLIGFGAGSTNLRIEVQVYQMMESGLQRIKEVEGQARGSRMPGVAGPGAIAGATGQVAGVAVAGGMSTVREVRGGIKADVHRLAERFGYKTIALYYRQGWR